MTGEAGAVALPCKMSEVRRFRNIGMSACVKTSGTPYKRVHPLWVTPRGRAFKLERHIGP
jgi:hypothetical protein